MSNCTNCFNGCTEIVSDRCVRYTGIDIPALGITTGDTLSFVEESIINFLVPVLNGSGVKPVIQDAIICNVVRQYLPTCTICTGFTLNEVLTAIIKAACNLQEQIDSINSTIAILNADYTIECLTGVTVSSDTHAIVQAVINKLCQVQVDLTALLIDVETNYVSVADINTYIAAYINGASALVSAKMIPYVAVPFFPTPAFLSGKFDGTGAGIGSWDKIYLCNGDNATPDLRGRVLVGATTGMGGRTMNPAVNPGGANPNYSLGTTAGANQITLGPTQIPSHTHTATAVSIDSGHTHSILDAATFNANVTSTGGVSQYFIKGTDTTEIGNANITTSVTVNVAGGGLAHPNNQPAIGSYYIIYIP